MCSPSMCFQIIVSCCLNSAPHITFQMNVSPRMWYQTILPCCLNSALHITFLLNVAPRMWYKTIVPSCLSSALHVIFLLNALPSDLVSEALAQSPALANLPWVDLGTGSGAIAIAAAEALQQYNKVCRGTGVCSIS